MPADNTDDSETILAIDELVTSRLFPKERERLIGCLIKETIPSPGTMQFRYGIVRFILPIVDELAVTYRLLCEENLDSQRQGRSGGWFLTSPGTSEVVETHPADGPIHVTDRIDCCSPSYRKKLLERCDDD